MFLDIENLLLFPRNLFRASHPEEYWWFQGGPREILEVLRDSRGSRDWKGVEDREHPGGSRGSRGPGNPEVPGLSPTFLPCLSVCLDSEFQTVEVISQGS